MINKNLCNQIHRQVLAYTVARKHYGDKAQITKTLEELSEFAHELEHWMIHNDNKEKVIEELADVENMLAQMKDMLDIHFSVECVKREKMERTISRIQEEIIGT